MIHRESADEEAKKFERIDRHKRGDHLDGSIKGGISLRPHLPLGNDTWNAGLADTAQGRCATREVRICWARFPDHLARASTYQPRRPKTT